MKQMIKEQIRYWERIYGTGVTFSRIISRLNESGYKLQQTIEDMVKSREIKKLDNDRYTLGSSLFTINK